MPRESPYEDGVAGFIDTVEVEFFGGEFGGEVFGGEVVPVVGLAPFLMNQGLNIKHEHEQ